ncbi:protoporphyrinogen oxidase [Stieleria varia]|uniref:Coproporphyrinogen III oxidase n=1 Tax=Stieleria varia TaxID=2528005 RepID=A0A5C5ZZ13_9BACT|nr:protoporphyrinogen oxidase [Stieleria varia]TWT91553.1 Protoporphyrinogen oxidase [Stieleria varia]
MSDSSSSLSSAQRRVVIIGGGLSGLATAVHLHLLDPSLQLTVLESADRVGGVIHTQQVTLPSGQSFVLDHGADMFATQPPAALKLCERLGVADQLILPNTDDAGAMIVFKGRLQRIPDGFVLMRATRVWPMITTPLLSPLAKLRLLAERWVRPENSAHRNKQQNTEGNTGQNSADPDGDVSVAHFVRRRMGTAVLDKIVSPLVAGIYTADVERLSMLATMAPIAEMVRQHGSLTAATRRRKREGSDGTERNSAGARYHNFRAFRGGMIQLIQSLTAALPDQTIQTQADVQSLNWNASQKTWAVRTGDHEIQCDAVVLATPARVSARLLQTIPTNDLKPAANAAADQLSQIESASAAIAVLVVRKDQISKPIDFFGFVVPMLERRRILAGSFASVKFAGRCDDDHLIVRVFMGGALQSELLERDDDQLIRIAREELADLVGLSGDPVYAAVVRWNAAMPQYHVGHLERVRQIESNLAKLPALEMTSNALHGVGIAPVISAAESTAKKIVEQLSPDPSDR